MVVLSPECPRSVSRKSTCLEGGLVSNCQIIKQIKKSNKHRALLGDFLASKTKTPNRGNRDGGIALNTVVGFLVDGDKWYDLYQPRKFGGAWTLSLESVVHSRVSPDRGPCTGQCRGEDGWVALCTHRAINTAARLMFQWNNDDLMVCSVGRSLY